MKKTLLMLSALPVTAVAQTSSAQQTSNATASQDNRPVNVIYIMADDLGIGDLGCYGQKKIKTPTIDSLARAGVIFTNHYSGSTVSAPSRASLMTGRHTGHSPIRGNMGIKGSDGSEYDAPLPDSMVTLGEMFRSKGYATACIGKWGLGGPESEGAPLRQGFDRFFGFLSQLNAHHHYPQFLWDDSVKVMLGGKKYAQDLFIENALRFVEDNKERPFFLMFTPTIPHAGLEVPSLGEYDGAFGDTPYKGGWYASVEQPRAAYAAMVTRLDSDIERLCRLLRKEGIADRTIIIFTSDNGCHIEGGNDPDFFNSSGGFRGRKRDLYEGGVRTPFVVSWPGVVEAGSVCDHVSAFWDFMPTMAELIGADIPAGCDGISYLPSLRGGEQKKHGYIYFEFHEEGGKRSIMKDGWKLIELNAKDKSKHRYELYNLASDPMERHDMSVLRPDKVKQLIPILEQARTEHADWRF